MCAYMCSQNLLATWSTLVGECMTKGKSFLSVISVVGLEDEREGGGVGGDEKVKG